MSDDAPDLEEPDEEFQTVQALLRDYWVPGQTAEFRDLILLRLNCRRALYGMFYKGEQFETIDVSHYRSIRGLRGALTTFNKLADRGLLPVWEHEEEVREELEGDQLNDTRGFA